MVAAARGPVPGCLGQLCASPSPIMDANGSSSLQGLLLQLLKTWVIQWQPPPRLGRAVSCIFSESVLAGSRG